MDASVQGFEGRSAMPQSTVHDWRDRDSEIERLRTELAARDEELSKLSDNVAQMEQRLQDKETRLDRMAEEVARVSEERRMSLERKLAEGDKKDRQVASLIAAVEGVFHLLEGSREKLQAMHSKVVLCSNTERELEQAKASLECLGRDVAAREEAVQKLERQLADRAAMVACLEGEVKKAQRRLKSTMQERDELAASRSDIARKAVQKLERQLADRTALVARLEGEAKKVQRRLKSLRQERDELAASRSDIEQRVAGFQEHINLLMADVTQGRTIAQELERQRQELAIADAERRKVDRMERASARELGRVISSLIEENGWPLPPAIKRRRMLERLRKTGLVDPEWYIKRNDDVAAANLDPTEHYLLFGAREGRPPSTHFVRQPLTDTTEHSGC